MSRRLPINRTRSGEFRLNIDDNTRAVLLKLTDELAVLDVEHDSNSPIMRRLHPAAYHQDPEHDDEYQRLMADELRASRASAINEMRGALTGDSLTEAQVYGLMRSCNSMRLVIGTQLDIGEGDDPDLPDDHPMAPFYDVYEYLGYFIECAVRALSS